jgi:hypothetical protein
MLEDYIGRLAEEVGQGKRISAEYERGCYCSSVYTSVWTDQSYSVVLIHNPMQATVGEEGVDQPQRPLELLHHCKLPVWLLHISPAKDLKGLSHDTQIVEE